MPWSLALDFDGRNSQFVIDDPPRWSTVVIDYDYESSMTTIEIGYRLDKQLQNLPECVVGLIFKRALLT